MTARQPTSPRRSPAAAGYPLDTTKILERIGGDRELLKELAGLFVGDCPRMLSDIRDAVRDGNAEALHKAAHALKGSVSNFAAEAAVQAAFRLEMMGRNRDMTDAAQALKELEREIERVCEGLSALARESERVRILIAEDDPVTRKLLEAHLAKWGHEVVVCSDGAQAWQVLSCGGSSKIGGPRLDDA